VKHLLQIEPNSSVRKFGRAIKIRRHRSRRFLKNSVKINENQKNSVETHRRRQRNSETKNTRRCRFLTGRPTVVCPVRFSAESDRFSPRRRGFLWSPTHPHAPPGLSAQPPITTRFRPVFSSNWPISDLPNPASAPLSTGANGERRIHSVTELGRLNTIYISSGPSESIFMFLIQFKFYPTKRLRFEKFSPPMFLEIYLIFYIIFSDFLFFPKFPNFK
jgi:hypothetical protein